MPELKNRKIHTRDCKLNFQRSLQIITAGRNAYTLYARYIRIEVLLDTVHIGTSDCTDLFCTRFVR